MTRWTAVLKVRQSNDAPGAQEALEDLCRDYWYPLYAFARRQGRNAHDAQDLTQGFFSYVVEKNLFASADSQLGKLRTFLLTAFQRYIGDVKDREHAQKRGGGREIFSLDVAEGEERYVSEPADSATPEVLYERSWALTVLLSALRELGKAEERAGRGAQFVALESFLSPTDGGEGNYQVTAGELGMSEAAVRQMVSRLRRKFRDCLRQVIAETLDEPTEERVNEELRSLRASLQN